jgi:hypothetical protein
VERTSPIGISRVILRVRNREPILATFSNGWYSAWWPGPQRDIVGIEEYDATGTPVAQDERFATEP